MDFLGRLQQELTHFVEGIAAALPRIGLGLLVFLAAYIVTRFIRRAIVLAIQDTPAGLAVERALARVVSIVGISIALVIALATTGVDVGALVAGLGLTGLALGLALKDTLENAITGILLLIQRPFDVGDIIQVAGFLGTVTDIAIRTTHLKQFDGLEVIIPNAQVYNNSITNWSAYPTRRLDVTVGVAYDTDMPKAIRAISESVKQTQGVIEDPAPLIHFDAFDDSALNIIARFWIDWRASSPLDVKDAVIRNITQAARREGINIPFPIRTVYMQQTAG
jgi:small conductance mechanosensitive channel